jgi:hypothetical protein
LCLEFGEDSRLVRREHLIGVPWGPSAMRRCMKPPGKADESGEK